MRAESPRPPACEVCGGPQVFGYNGDIECHSERCRMGSEAVQARVLANLNRPDGGLVGLVPRRATTDDRDRARHAALDRAIEIIIASLRSGGTLYACGNGGSDAHAGHLVAELVGRYAYDRPPLRAVHLSSGGPVGSCIANDYGWEQVFARQVEALVRGDDVLVVFTTSGESENVLYALEAAWNFHHAALVILCGPRGIKASGSPRGFDTTPPAPCIVRSTATTTPAIQEDHQAWVHEIARRAEEALCPR